MSANDTASSTNPPSSAPGYFHGTVLGPSQPGAGNDSLATAPRIADVRVTIYERMPGTGVVQTGAEAGSVVTSTTGEFTLPTLPAGEYVVTFIPPAGSPYNGVYVSGRLDSNRSKYPWWVVLSKK